MELHMNSDHGGVARVPVVTLNNGIEMPVLGLGVLGPSDETSDAVAAALACGYRMVDTAAAYGNERAVGYAIRNGPVVREDVFVITKLWMTQYGDRARAGFEASLDRLNMDYVDLYLLHWPVPSVFDQTLKAYRAAERLLSEGLVRAIGVCNFEPDHLDSLVAATDIVPAVNQVELHPFFTQRAVQAADARLGTVTQAWSPLGGVYGYRRSSGADDPSASPLDHPVVKEIALRHHKTCAQVVLRWHLQVGVAVIPKSFRPDRIAENRDVFDFVLSPDEVEAISDLDTGIRAGADPNEVLVDTFKADLDNW
jgi:diketogulonate reductase-like aldo/keto reductase